MTTTMSLADVVTDPRAHWTGNGNGGNSVEALARRHVWADLVNAEASSELMHRGGVREIRRKPYHRSSALEKSDIDSPVIASGDAHVASSLGLVARVVRASAGIVGLVGGLPAPRTHRS